MSERSEFFFKENEKATPQARPQSRKSGSPSPAAPQNGKSGSPSRAPGSSDLNQLHSHGSRLITADAQGRHTALQATLFEGVDQGDDDPCAGRADGMAQGTGAAV